MPPSAPPRRANRRLSTGEDASFYFQRFDKGGTGELDIQEFGMLLLELELLKPARAKVAPPSTQALRGSLERHEIVATMKMATPLGPELVANKQWLHEQFFQADLGGDGALSFEEFREYWERSILPRRKSFCELYQLHKSILGEGAFGTVRKATQLASRREVAIKYISKQEAEMIHAEIAVWEGLHHPALLELLDVQETEDHVALVTEIMPGGDLFQALRKLGDRITERHVLGLAKQIISAVAYLHERGIVHSDLKPSNVLVLEPLAKLVAPKKKRPTAIQHRSTKTSAAVAPAPMAPSAAPSAHVPILTVRVADFGLSQLRPSAAGQAAGQTSLQPPAISRGDSAADLFAVQGTSEYYAPELARLALKQPVGLLPKGYGEAVDEWAVGCILFEMLVGEPPYGHHMSERSLFMAIIEQPTEEILARVTASPATLELLRGFLTPEPTQRLKCADALERAEAWASLQTGDDSADEHPTGRALGDAVAKRREATGQHRTLKAKEASPPKPPLLEWVSTRMQRSIGALPLALSPSRSTTLNVRTATLLNGGGPPPGTSETRAPGARAGRRLRRSAEIFIQKVKSTLNREPPSPHKVTMRLSESSA